MSATLPQNYDPVSAGPFQYQALGCSQITVSAACGLGSGVNASGVPVPIPVNALMAAIICEGSSVRWCDDGQVPTATFGNLLTAGAGLQYSGPLSAIQFFAVSGTPVLGVAFYR